MTGTNINRYFSEENTSDFADAGSLSLYQVQVLQLLLYIYITPGQVILTCVVLCYYILASQNTSMGGKFTQLSTCQSKWLSTSINKLPWQQRDGGYHVVVLFDVWLTFCVGNIEEHHHHQLWWYDNWNYRAIWSSGLCVRKAVSRVWVGSGCSPNGRYIHPSQEPSPHSENSIIFQFLAAYEIISKRNAALRSRSDLRRPNTNLASATGTRSRLFLPGSRLGGGKLKWTLSYIGLRKQFTSFGLRIWPMLWEDWENKLWVVTRNYILSDGPKQSGQLWSCTVDFLSGVSSASKKMIHISLRMFVMEMWLEEARKPQPSMAAHRASGNWKHFEFNHPHLFQQTLFWMRLCPQTQRIQRFASRWMLWSKGANTWEDIFTAQMNGSLSDCIVSGESVAGDNEFPFCNNTNSLSQTNSAIDWCVWPIITSAKYLVEYAEYFTWAVKYPSHALPTLNGYLTALVNYSLHI